MHTFIHTHTLADQVGSDELVTSLDVLIDSFARRMPPYAQGLCQRLADTFFRLAHDADTDSSLAASQCCSAISTLLDALNDSNSPALFASIEPSVIPLLLECLTPDASGEYAYTEFIEDVLEIITRLTYYAPEISAGMWSLYLPLTKCFTDWAWDYLSEFQMALNNYVSRAPAAFVSVPQRPEALLRMMQRVLESADAQVLSLSLSLSRSLFLSCARALSLSLCTCTYVYTQHTHTHTTPQTHKYTTGRTKTWWRHAC